jgi:2-haloacid dehalogenase
LPDQPLTSVKTCVFDAYGTLFDFASAARASPDVPPEAAERLSALWRDKQLQYSWLRVAQHRHADFLQVTADALDFTLETLGLEKPGLAPFPEVPQALAQVRAAGLKTAILSNGTPAMLTAAVGAAGLGPLFDAVLSVEEVGAFKPDPRVYQLAVDRLGTPASSIVFVSSNGWDAYAASAFGMQVVWCNRYGQRRERLPGAPDREITTLAALPALVGG